MYDPPLIARNIAQDYCDVIHKLSFALLTFLDRIRFNGGVSHELYQSVNDT